MKRSIWLMIFMVVLVNCGLCAERDAVSPAEVRGMVRNLKLPQDKLSSLALDMSMNLPIPMKINIQLRYSHDDKYTLQVFDGFDQTPILVVAGRKAMINDPMADSISLIASAGVAFELVPQGDNYNANFAFNMPVDGKINNRVELDFTSLFSRVAIDVIATYTADGKILFSGKTEQKSSCRASFVASRSFPLNSLSLFVPGQEEAVIEFPLIDVGSVIDEDVFTFPSKRLADSGVKFVELKPDGMVDTMMVVASVMRAIFSRAAIRNVSLRAEIEKNLMYAPDWEKHKKNDLEKSKLLKKVFMPFNH